MKSVSLRRRITNEGERRLLDDCNEGQVTVLPASTRFNQQLFAMGEKELQWPPCFHEEAFVE